MLQVVKSIGEVGGADDLHLPGWKLELPEPTQKSLKDYKVAVWADDALAPVDQGVKDRVLKVAALVEAAGGQVDYEARPAFDPDHSHRQYENLLHSAMSARQPEEMFKANVARRAGLEPGDDSALARVTIASSLYYREWHMHNENRTHLRWAWHEFFKDYDILLTPMCSTPAFPHDHNPQIGQRQLTVNNEIRPYMEQLFWAGLTGVAYLPSTIVPTGPNEAGLPIGVQIASREMGDLYTIEFARKVAEQLGGFVAPKDYED